MKKVFTFLMAMVIVSASFAQVSRNLTRIPGADKTLNKEKISLVKQTRNFDQAKTSGEFWYDYGAGLASFYNVEELSWDWYPMCGDTTTYYPWNGSAPSALPYTSVGRAFDWSNMWWNSFYYGSSLYTNVPALAATDSYTIDSVGMYFDYEHADDVSLDRVDTLVISYVVNLDNQPFRNVTEEDEITLETLYFGAFFTWLPVDPATSIPAYNNVMGDTLDPAALIYTQKFPLTIQDTTKGFEFRTFPAPAELQNLSCDRLAVFYTYKPGTQGQHSEFWSTCNAFHWLNWIEPREEYNNGGTAPENDLNWDYKVDMRYSLNSASAYYGCALPEILYAPTDPDVAVTHDIQSIALHATCNDCAFVNVEDVEKEIATIYPNPATSEINVVTNSNEKTLVEMFNLVGQRVYSEQFVNSTKINVSNMKAGVYMLRVNNHTTKVVVK